MNLDALFLLDDQRNQAIKRGDLKAFRQSYQQPLGKITDLNTAEFWGEKVLQKTAAQDPMRRDRVATALSYIPPATSRHLNIGVGDGRLEALMAHSHPDTHRLGLDITVKGLAAAYRSSRFDPICGSIYSLPFHPPFTSISVLEVLEHLPYSRIFSVLADIHALLAKHGRFIVSVPVNETYGSGHNPNHHLRRYSRDIILAELELAGFQIEQVTALYAFRHFYPLKSLLASTLLPKRWKPNVLVILATKK